MAKTFINSDQITAIASRMKAKGENILNEYKQNCVPALNMSTESLQLSGLDTVEFFKSLESIYVKLNEKINEFSDFLINTVAVEYDFTSRAIATSFNGTFAQELAGLLGISVGVGATIPTNTGGKAVVVGGASTSAPTPTTSARPSEPVTPAPDTTTVKTCSGATIKTCSGTTIKTCSGVAITPQKSSDTTTVKTGSDAAMTQQKSSAPVSVITGPFSGGPTTTVRALTK